MNLNRRKFLTGMLAAPLVVKAEVLMPVQKIITPEPEIIGMDFGGRTAENIMVYYRYSVNEGLWVPSKELIKKLNSTST